MGNYTKGIIAAVSAGLIALQTALSDGGVSTADWVTIAIAVVGAISVFVAPNAGSSDPQVPPVPPTLPQQL